MELHNGSWHIGVMWYGDSGNEIVSDCRAGRARDDVVCCEDETDPRDMRRCGDMFVVERKFQNLKGRDCLLGHYSIFWTVGGFDDCYVLVV